MLVLPPMRYSSFFVFLRYLLFVWDVRNIARISKYVMSDDIMLENGGRLASFLHFGCVDTHPGVAIVL